MFLVRKQLIFLGLDVPVLSIPNLSPKEGEDVTLTCEEKTSDTSPVYSWFHNGTVMNNKNDRTLELPAGKRTSDGEYYCKVTTAKFTTPKSSAKKTIKFLCEFV